MVTVPIYKMVLVLGQRWEIWPNSFLGQMQLNTDLSEVCSGHQANVFLLDEGWSKVNGQALVVLEVVPLEETRECQSHWVR